MMDAAVRDRLLITSPCAASGRGRRSVLPRFLEPVPAVITRERWWRRLRNSTARWSRYSHGAGSGSARHSLRTALRGPKCWAPDHQRGAHRRQRCPLLQTPKNHQRRTMAINDGWRYVLREHLERHVPSSPDALLFTGRTGQPLRTPSVYRYVWKPALVGAGLEGSHRIPSGALSARGSRTMAHRSWTSRRTWATRARR